jgi:hypothetical protein
MAGILLMAAAWGALEWHWWWCRKWIDPGWAFHEKRGES